MTLSSVVAQRPIPIDQTFQKTVETPQLQRIDRVSDGPVVQVEHVPQSHVAEKTVEIPQLDVVKKTVETPEIQQRNVDQIVDTPVPQIVEELAEAPRFSLRTGLNSVLQNRPSNTLLIHSLRKSSRYLTFRCKDGPVPQLIPQKCAQQSHRWRVGSQRTRRERESILTQSDMPVVVQRQVSMVQKAMEAPQMQVMLKTVENPQLQIVEKTADGRTETPEIQTVRGNQTSKSLGIVPEHQPAQAETVKVDKIGAPLSAESASPISVTASVLQNPPVVVGSVQPVHTAEYVAHAHAFTHAHGAPVVECATSTHTVACAAPVTTPQHTTQHTTARTHTTTSHSASDFGCVLHNS